MRIVSFVIGAALLLIGCAHVPMGEHVVFVGSEIVGWKIADYKNYPNESYFRFYVSPGDFQRIAQKKPWSEMIVVGYDKSPGVPVKQYVEDKTKVTVRTNPS